MVAFFCCKGDNESYMNCKKFRSDLAERIFGFGIANVDNKNFLGFVNTI